MLISLFLFLIVIYGSLYPFNFDFEKEPEFWQALIEAPLWTGVLDAAGNVLLFMPLVLWLAVRLRSNNLLIALLTVLVAVDMQVLQVFLPSRSPALSDILWNSAGIFCALLLAKFKPLRAIVINTRFPVTTDKLAIVCLCIWAVSQLIPLVPDMNWLHWQQKFWQFRNSTLFYSSHFLFQFFIALALVEFFLAQHWRLRWLAVLLLCVLLYRSWLMHTGLDWPRLIAWPMALLCASVWLRFSKVRRFPPLAAGLAITYLLTGFIPFVFRDIPINLQWLPFDWLLSSNRLPADMQQLATSQHLQQLLERCFVLCALGYFLISTAVRAKYAVLAISTLVFVSELAQRSIYWQVANTDELFLWLLIALVTLFIAYGRNRLRQSAWSERHTVWAAMLCWTVLNIVFLAVESTKTVRWLEQWINYPTAASLSLLAGLLVLALVIARRAVQRRETWVAWVKSLAVWAGLFAIMAVAITQAAIRPSALLALFYLPSVDFWQPLKDSANTSAKWVDTPLLLTIAWRWWQLFIASLVFFAACKLSVDLIRRLGIHKRIGQSH